MAGRSQSKLYRVALNEARQHGNLHPLPSADPAKVLQGIVNRITAQYEHASAKVDELPEDELTFLAPEVGLIDTEWVRAEKDLRRELATLCINMEKVGLAERWIKLEEAKAALIVRALRAAAADVGIPAAQVREIGPAFRRHLEAIEGAAA